MHSFSAIVKLLLKWDNNSLEEIEKIQKQLKEEKEKRLKEAMEDPKIFEKYYKK